MIAVICFTELGEVLGHKLAGGLPDVELTRCPSGGLSEWTAKHFPQADGLVFIGSVGLAVRAIAVHVSSKVSDPAVVVVDEQAQFAISVLSGHIGQANALTRRIAGVLDATPVVTTATDTRGLFAVDEWATQHGLCIANPERIKTVSAALLAGKPIRFACEFPIVGSFPQLVMGDQDTWDVIVTCRTLSVDDPALHLVPPVVSAGVGCRKGVSPDTVSEAFYAALASAQYHRLSICEVCSIDLKATEPGLVSFCEREGLGFRTFSAEELNHASGDFTSSDFVTSTVGVDNVCERAAVLGSGGYVVAQKFSLGGVTVALALREPLLSFDVAQDKEE